MKTFGMSFQVDAVAVWEAGCVGDVQGVHGDGRRGMEQE